MRESGRRGDFVGLLVPLVSRLGGLLGSSPAGSHSSCFGLDQNFQEIASRRRQHRCSFDGNLLHDGWHMALLANRIRRFFVESAASIKRASCAVWAASGRSARSLPALSSALRANSNAAAGRSVSESSRRATL